MAWLGFWLMVIGAVVMTNLSPCFQGDASSVMFTSYVPMQANTALLPRH